MKCVFFRKYLFFPLKKKNQGEDFLGKTAKSGRFLTGQVRLRSNWQAVAARVRTPTPLEITLIAEALEFTVYRVFLW